MILAVCSACVPDPTPKLTSGSGIPSCLKKLAPWPRHNAAQYEPDDSPADHTRFQTPMARMIGLFS